MYVAMCFCVHVDIYVMGRIISLLMCVLVNCCIIHNISAYHF